MSKKIFVIEEKDWKKFLHEITWDSVLRDQDFESHPTLVDVHQIGQAVADKLLRHEVEAVEFEATVDSHWHIPAMELPQTFEPTDKVGVFVVKKEEK